MTSESRTKPTKTASMSTIPDKKPKKITQTVLAKHLCLPRGDRSIRELFDKQILPSDIDRQNLTTSDLDRCREAYILHLRETAAGRAPKEVDPDDEDSLDLATERALLARQQRLESVKRTEGHVIKNQRAAGQLIERGKQILASSAMNARIRSELLKHPKRVVKQLRGKDEDRMLEILFDDVYFVLKSLSEVPIEVVDDTADEDADD